MLKKVKPYCLHNLIDRFARRNWYSSSGYKPSMVIKAQIDVSVAQNYAKDHNFSVNTLFIKAIAQALCEFPKLNYYSFWGRPVWGGDSVRISVVYEVGDEGAINLATIYDADTEGLESIQEKINSLSTINIQSNIRPTLKTILMNRLPLLSYFIMRYTGALERNYIKEFSPVIFSNVNVHGISEIISGGIGFVAMIISPGRIQDGRCSFNVAFNHEVTNGRPVGRYLSRIKEIIEQMKLTNTK